MHEIYYKDIYINGQSLSLSYLRDSSTNTYFVPLDQFFKALDTSVQFQGNAKTVLAIKDDIVMHFRLNNMICYINENPLYMGESTKLKDGIVYVPLNFLEDVLNLHVLTINDSIQIEGQIA